MKLFHSLRFRFAFIFSVFIIILSVSLSLLGIRQTTKAASDVFSAQGIAIVEKAVSFVDGDSFETLVKSLDKNDPFYEETRVKLFELKELSGCRYLYTMAQVDKNIWRYIIDGSGEPDDPDNFSALGDEEDTGPYDDAFRQVLISGKTESGTRIKLYEYKIAQIDKKMLNLLKSAYGALHLAGYYHGDTKISTIKDGFDDAYEIIEKIKPDNPIDMPETRGDKALRIWNRFVISLSVMFMRKPY